MMRRFVILFAIVAIIIYANQGKAQPSFATQSVLAQGTWYKIGITQSGLYRIDRSLLNALGINTASINPQHLHLYGNGGAMLPQPNNAPRPDDLIENAISVVGEADGVWNDGDYALFYAQAPTTWRYNPLSGLYEHQTNIYSDTSYYFITFNPSPAKRITEQTSQNGATQSITQFDDYQVSELDLINLLRSGREWYGEDFNFQSTRLYNFNLSGWASGTPIRITSAVMANTLQASSFQISAGGQVLGTQNIAASSAFTFAQKGFDNIATFTLSGLPSGETLPVAVGFSPNGGGVGYVNYVRVQYSRRLQLYGNQTAFRAAASLSADVSNFVVANAPSDLEIWDISTLTEPRHQRYHRQGNDAVFGANTTTLREWLMWRGSNFPAPVAFGAIPNQNLHAMAIPDMLIISPEFLLPAAQRLASFRQQHDQLSVAIATPRQIYNEFSSGKQDLSALRDFVRMLYSRNPQKMKYLLLLGNASYDYKNRIKNNTNLVPTYESYNSLHPVFSFSSDDYFGLLGDNEGIWLEDGTDNPDLEIGIGRITVGTLAEANAVIDKIIYYQTNPKTLGDWRQRITFVADDGDGNIHQYHADELAEKINTDAPVYEAQKLFLDAFPQQAGADGETCKALTERIIQEVERGTLVLNYTGHGGEVGWAEEKLLTISSIANWKNLNRLPLLFTATCEFGRYDNPQQISSGEVALRNARGGAIALLTTTRPVFASTNLLLNRAFYTAAFTPLPSGEMPRLGDIMRQTKNAALLLVNRNFVLLGDPAMRLAYPAEQIAITHINQKPTDTLRALQTTRIAGEVRTPGGGRASNFNGQLNFLVYDKRTTARTLGSAAAVMPYQVRENVLFRGLLEVQNGYWEASFVVPKDIDYRFGAGKILLYAQTTTGYRDAAGAMNNIIVGGSASNFVQDNTPPTINLHWNDTNAPPRQPITPDALLIAQLSDASGINLSRLGIGHEIKAWIDDKPETVVILNDFYTANINTYQHGEVRYPWQGLPEGKHTLTLEAWDTYNNVARQSLEFWVNVNPNIALSEVKVYPNPVQEQAIFSFRHDQKRQDLNIQIEIFDVLGRKIRTLQAQAFADEAGVVSLAWNRLDQQGRRAGTGLMSYRLTVQAGNGAQGTATGKIVVMND